jgi:hypothetical protein
LCWACPRACGWTAPATGGLLATALGLRPDLIIGSAVMFAGTAVAIASPLRSLRDLPPQQDSRERLAA